MFELSIQQCPRDNIDALSNLLEGLYALSITLTDEFDDPILEPAPGAAPLWPHVVIQALFEHEQEAIEAMNMLNTIQPQLTYLIKPVIEQDWERVCLDQFTPQKFGERLWICPSWHTPPDRDAVNLVLDPGLAFGTGSHATTSLCLKWLDAACLNLKHVIDYGCGSGILALAALKLGASHVFAVDIDEQALAATKENANRNDIPESTLTISQPEALHTPVDLLIANILLAPLLTLKNRFYELLNQQGTLVVSGLLATQISMLTDAYQDLFICVSSIIDGEWALVEFRAK